MSELGLDQWAVRQYDELMAKVPAGLLPLLDVTIERNAYGRQRESFAAEGEAPSQRTDARIAYDERALYVAVFPANIYMAVNEIQHWEFADKRPEDEKVREASYETTSVYGFGHPLYYENVNNTRRGEAEPETDGREGLRSLELLIAIYISARDGRRVTLPLDY